MEIWKATELLLNIEEINLEGIIMAEVDEGRDKSIIEEEEKEKISLDKTKRLEHKLRSVEKRDRMLKKDRSLDRSVLEEVFDRSTLMTIYELMNKGEIEDIFGVVKAGKESRLYWGTNPNGEEIAIKIYLTVSAEFKKGMLPYIIGDPRFKSIKRDTRSLIYAWAHKEFRNLLTAYKVGVTVPKPIDVKNNVLLMEFIGKDGVSAPLMREVKLRNPKKIFQRLLSEIRKLYREARLVHGDLSEYNIMIWKGQPVIFDLSQAVLIDHPNAEEFLKRDVENLCRFFEKIGISVPSAEEILRRIIRERV